MPTPATSQQIARAGVLWREAVPPAGTLVETYLADRGLSLANDVIRADALRFHPTCPFKVADGSITRFPAMVALMRDVRTNEPRAIHRTGLKSDGSGKADMPDGTSPKKMLGPAKDCVIKLCADEDVTIGVGIAEGIETGLAVIGVGWRPVWACGSAGAIASFPILSGVDCLTVWADADDTGMAAAQQCKARWIAARLECVINIPQAEHRHGQ